MLALQATTIVNFLENKPMDAKVMVLWRRCNFDGCFLLTFRGNMSAVLYLVQTGGRCLMKKGIKRVAGVVVLAGVGFAGVYYGKQLGKEDTPKREEPPSAMTTATPEYSAEPKEPVAATPPELREALSDAAVSALSEEVDEIGESETAKSVLKDLAGGGSSDTNAPSPTATDIAVDILGEQVDEVGENEFLKDILKGFGNSLFN